MVEQAPAGVEEDNKSFRICYIGKDSGFWNNIKQEFDTRYDGLNKEYFELSADDRKNIKYFIFDVIRLKFDVIYLDFSLFPEEMMVLAKLLSRDNSTKKSVKVGLFDLLAKRILLHEAALVGVRANHIKTPEIHDVVYDAVYLKNFEKVKDPPFALANLARQTPPIKQFITVKRSFRVVYVDNTHMHIETNAEFVEGENVKVEWNVLSKIVSSGQFIAGNEKTDNMSYQLARSYDFKFHYIDPLPPLADGHSQEDVDKYKERNGEREINVNLVKKKLTSWVDEYAELTNSKKTKVLIVDKDLAILKELEGQLIKFPYFIRFQTALTNAQEELNRMKPHLIVFQCTYEVEEIEDEDDDDDEEDETGIDQKSAKALVDINVEALKNLTESFKVIEKYNPFLLIFNAKERDTAFFQAQLGHKQVVAYPELCKSTQLLGLAQAFETKYQARLDERVVAKIDELKKKDAAKYRNLKVADLKEKKVHFNDRDIEKSSATFSFEVQLMALSESEAYIISEKKLMMFTCLQVDSPASMFLTIVPHIPESEESKIRNCYKTIINGIDEEAKQGLRRVINDIFFTELKGKKAEEKAKFDEVNKKAKRKMENEKVKAETEAKQAAEEAELAKQEEESAKEAKKGPHAPQLEKESENQENKKKS